jgi:hypothetical protein
MGEEDLCLTLLCYFPDTCDILVMDIGSTVNTLVLDEVVVSLLSKVSLKYFEYTNEALVFMEYRRRKERREKRENPNLL